MMGPMGIANMGLQVSFVTLIGYHYLNIPRNRQILIQRRVVGIL